MERAAGTVLLPRRACIDGSRRLWIALGVTRARQAADGGPGLCRNGGSRRVGGARGYRRAGAGIVARALSAAYFDLRSPFFSRGIFKRGKLGSTGRAKRGQATNFAASALARFAA